MSSHDPACPVDPPRTVGDGYCLWCEVIAEVRADQDDRECDHCTDLARLKITDLRAKVDALDYEMLGRSEYVRKDDVLDLLDGDGDE